MKPSALLQCKRMDGIVGHPPAKQRIYDHFVDGIQSGKIAAGERLPTEMEIAASFDVSRSTVQAVMSRLSHEGIVRRHPGRGTFACRTDDEMRIKVNLDIHNIQSFESEIAVQGDKVTYKLLTFAKVPPSPRAAEKLGIELSDEVFALHRLRFVGGECIGSELRYFSPEIRLNIGVADLEDRGAHSIVEDCLGIRIGRVDAVLRATIADPEDAERMEVKVGAPLLVRSHTLFSEEDKVILHGESFYVEPFSFRYSASLRA